MIKACYCHPNPIAAHDDTSGETWCLSDLVAHANGCEDQIDYLLAEIEAQDKRVHACGLEAQPANDNTSANGLAAQQRAQARAACVGGFVGGGVASGAAMALAAGVATPMAKADVEPTPEQRLVAVYRELLELVRGHRKRSRRDPGPGRGAADGEEGGVTGTGLPGT